MHNTLTPDACIACTACVVQCPVAEATPNFLGPRMVGPAQERFRLLGLDEESSLHYCANCKNCDIACPHGVPISTFNMLARAAQCKKHRPPLRDWILAHGEWMAKSLGFIPAALRNIGMCNPVTRYVLDKMGIAYAAPLPRFAAKTLRASLAAQQIAVSLPQTAAQSTVAFFPGCYIDVYDPQTGLDIIWLLQQAGYTVVVPHQFGCCGLPMVANGFWEDARRQAQQNLNLLQQCRQQNIPVLTACPSCALMFSHDYPLYFPDLANIDAGSADEDVAHPHGTALVDTQEFLLDCIAQGRLDLAKATGQGEILYHAPCHLRAQGLGLPGLELLRTIPKTTAHNADAGCCGISGSYGFKKEKYPIAMQVGAQLFATINASNAHIVSSECGTCRVQMRHGAKLDAQKRACLHPASILRRAIEGNEPQI